MSPFSKFFVFLLGLALFAAACAWIMGGETAKYSSRISIKASPSDVFRYLTEGDKIKQWAKDVVSVGTFTDDEDLRSQDRVVSSENGDMVWEDSVIRFTQDEEANIWILSIQSKKGGLTNTIVFQLEPNDLGETNLEYRQTKSASGLEQFTFSFQEDNTQTEMVAELARLKKLIESEVDPADRPAAEDEAPLVDSTTEDNNTTSGPMDSGSNSVPDTDTSIIDKVLGPAGGVKEDDKPEDGLRKFESLFGTGG